MLKIRVKGGGMIREFYLEDNQAQGLKAAMAEWEPGKYEVLELDDDQHIWELKRSEAEAY